MADELVIEDDSTEETDEELVNLDEETTSEDDDLEIVATDDEGNEYIEAPEGGLFGEDGLTNVQRTSNPSYGDPRDDGLVGVGEDYPAQADRRGANGGDDDSES